MMGNFRRRSNIIRQKALSFFFLYFTFCLSILLLQACRNGLVQHLENLLFYGAEMNAKNASGNTPLHVCAVDNQEACARLLLFRGADREALNYANQTPYQVAVIAGNLELASLIHRFRSEDVGTTSPFLNWATFSLSFTD